MDNAGAETISPIGTWTGQVSWNRSFNVTTPYHDAGLQADCTDHFVWNEEGTETLTRVPIGALESPVPVSGSLTFSDERECVGWPNASTTATYSGSGTVLIDIAVNGQTLSIYGLGASGSGIPGSLGDGTPSAWSPSFMEIDITPTTKGLVAQSASPDDAGTDVFPEYSDAELADFGNDPATFSATGANATIPVSADPPTVQYSSFGAPPEQTTYANVTFTGSDVPTGLVDEDGATGIASVDLRECPTVEQFGDGCVDMSAPVVDDNPILTPLSPAPVSGDGTFSLEAAVMPVQDLGICTTTSNCFIEVDGYDTAGGALPPFAVDQLTIGPSSCQGQARRSQAMGWPTRW